MIHKQFIPSTTSKHKSKILLLLFLLFCVIILFMIKYHYEYSKLNLLDFSSKIMKSTKEEPVVLYESSTTICLLSNYNDENLNIILFHKQIPYIKELENCITYNANTFPLLSSNSKWYLLNSDGEILSAGDLIFNEIYTNQCKWISKNKWKNFFSPKILMELITFDRTDVSYETDFESLFQYNYHFR